MPLFVLFVASILVAALLGGPPFAHAEPPAPAHADRVAEPVDLDGAALPVDGTVLRGFDPPASRYGPGHTGVDLAAEPGTSVQAAMGGVVTFAGEVAGTGWVTVDHGGGLDTTYGDLDPRRVRAGDEVEAGEVLGRVAPKAAHLDWGARLNGSYVDPLWLLGEWRARLVPVTG